MKEIALTQGKFAIVDDEDYPHLSEFKWCVWGRYAARSVTINGVVKPHYMHRELAGATDDVLVDHINRNKLDNRRCNLRVCTASQNQANKRMSNNTTGYHGVTRDRGKFAARVERGGKLISLGRYDTVEAAARARDAGAYRVYGEFATLNFPDETPNPSAIKSVPRLDAMRQKIPCSHCGRTFTRAGMGQHARACGKS